MPRSRRSASAVLAAALAAALLSPAATPAAAAEGDTAVLAHLVDANHDGFSGLSVRPADGTGTARVLVPDWDGSGDRRNLHDLAVSPDGTRVAYSEYVSTPDFDPVRSRIVVHDLRLGGTARTVVEGEVSVDPYREPIYADLTFSPDGTTLVYAEEVVADYVGSSLRLYRVPVAGGTPVRVPVTDGTQFSSPEHTPSGDLVGYHFDETAQTHRLAVLPAAGGNPVYVSTQQGDAAQPWDLSFSEDGSRLTWAQGLPRGDGTFTSGVFVAAWSATGTAATLGAARLIATGAEYATPGFTADGAHVVAARVTGPWDAREGEVVRIPLAGGEPVPVAVTPEAEYAVRLGALDTTAPGAVRPGTAVLNGTSATLRFTPPSDSDAAAVLISRLQGSTVQKSRVRVPATATSWTDSGLTVGTAYTYRFEAVDSSGNTGPAASRSLRATKRPVVTASDPTSTTSAGAPFPVSFGTGNASTTRYTATWRPAGGTYAPWVTGVAGATRTFGAPAATGVAATTSRPGTTYQFAVRASDTYGNSTASVTSLKVVVPADQSAATFSTGVPAAVAVSGAWLGSTRTLSASGHRATLPSATSDRFQVVGERRTDGGTFEVYRGSTRVATVSTYASTRAVRQVLWTSPVATTTAAWSVRWVASGTAGRTKVALDGFALRR